MKKTISFAMLFATLVTLTAMAADLMAADKEGKYIAYYFYTTQRCATCRKIETLSSESITNSFRKELEDGTLVFQAVNIDEPQHKHFVQDFKLFTKSLVITRVNGSKTERFRNLPKVWELVYSPADFTNYVKSEISSFLAGK